MMLGRVLVQLDVPVWHSPPFLWMDRQNRRNTKQMIEVNRYRKIYSIKYYILAVMIAMASLWIIPTAHRFAGPDMAGISRGGAATKRAFPEW